MQLYKPNKPGRPEGTDKKLTPEIIEKVCEAYRKTPVRRLAALHAGETPYHLKRWIMQGEEDAQHCIDSLNAQLFFQVGKILADKAASILRRIEACPDNYRALTWILEKTYKEDFGNQSEMITELIENLKLLAYKGEGDNGDFDK